MLNIKYSFLYNSKWGLFEGVAHKVETMTHLKNLKYNLKYYEAVAVCFYCNNKPVLLKWR